MKNFFSFTVYLLAATFIISCAQHSMQDKASNNKEGGYSSSEMKAEAPMDEETEKADSVSGNANEFMSSSAAKETDSTKKFIRTADMKFKVKDVRKASFAIEDLVAKWDGFVTYTNLNSTVDYKTYTPVSADTTLETIFYTVANDVVVRIPNTNLDTTLKEIARHIDYLDYRVIKAEDVSLNMLSNQLVQKRLQVHNNRLINAIDEQGKKLLQTTGAEENLLNKTLRSDEAKLENLRLQEQVSFSTIKLNIYQRQAIKRELVENYKNIDEYTPSFGHRVKEAVKSGWRVCENIIVFFFEIWWLLLLFAGMWMAFRRFVLKKK
ncbi:MAG: DUF4349 domain-containing protein [Bacteroidetes bacterium]|nr:DUF4349 domain-containing protein [Bacteroidota bacterium]